MGNPLIFIELLWFTGNGSGGCRQHHQWPGCWRSAMEDDERTPGSADHWLQSWRSSSHTRWSAEKGGERCIFKIHAKLESLMRIYNPFSLLICFFYFTYGAKAIVQCMFQQQVLGSNYNQNPNLNSRPITHPRPRPSPNLNPTRKPHLKVKHDPSPLISYMYVFD